MKNKLTHRQLVVLANQLHRALLAVNGDVMLNEVTGGTEELAFIVDTAIQRAEKLLGPK